MKNVKKERLIIENIPLLLLKDENSKTVKGVIFIYHGWSSKKENYEFIGSIFALEGYQVVIPDSLNHGERGILEYEKESVMEENFWNTVINSVDEYFKIKDYLLEKGILLSKNISVMGSSMGAMISAGIFVKDDNILSAVIMNGACNWLDLDERVKESRNINRGRGINREVLEKYNPASNLEKFAGRPLLLQHGQEDTSVPIESQDLFFKQIKGFYKGNENKLRFSKTPNLNHHKTIGMIEESLIWFNEIYDLKNKEDR